MGKGTAGQQLITDDAEILELFVMKCRAKEEAGLPIGVR
jgi:hypothetical protein